MKINKENNNLNNNNNNITATHIHIMFHKIHSIPTDATCQRQH